MKKAEFCAVFLVILAVAGMTLTGCPQAGGDTSHASLSTVAGDWTLASQGRDFTIGDNGDFVADITVPDAVSAPGGDRTHFTGKVSFTDEMDVNTFLISELHATNNPPMETTLANMGITSFSVKLTRTGDILTFNAVGDPAKAAGINMFFSGDYNKTF
jgi:hypothetical protein